MNTQYFLYAIEVEKTGSITQAANNLFMGQPTLSKAIKDLESSLGFPVFQRTSRGVVPTARGEEFLTHAKKIAAQLRKMEQDLRSGDTSGQLFSLAISRVGYMAQAAAEFAATFDHRQMEVDILEANSGRIVDAVAYGHFVLGLVRVRAQDEAYLLRSLEERGLQYEQVWQADYVALMRADHPLAGKKRLVLADLEPYVQIAFADEEGPRRPADAHGPGLGRRHILVYDRATQFDLLHADLRAYLWASPLPGGSLQARGLVWRGCDGAGQFRDLLISRAGYRFSRLDRAFIDGLYLQRNRAAYDD